MQYVENSGAANAFQLHDTAGNTANGAVSSITFSSFNQLNIYVKLLHSKYSPNIICINLI